MSGEHVLGVNVQPVGGDAGVHEIVGLEARDAQHLGRNLYRPTITTTTITSHHHIITSPPHHQRLR